MPAIDPVVYGRVADFIRGAVQSIFDSRFDWTPDAESILVLMREGGMTPNQERRFRPYFDLFVEQARRGEISGFKPSVDDETFLEYPPRFDLEALLTPPASADNQIDLFDGAGTRADTDRALIDQLIAATKLYDSREALTDLLEFTARQRGFAPFNAMLLHIQKPGLTYAATAQEWNSRFGRFPKTGARPLLVLRTMGPVEFVFDIQDTEGRPVPEEAFTFPTLGTLSEARLDELLDTLWSAGIDLEPQKLGDSWAGWIKCISRSATPRGRHRYALGYNCSHPPAIRLVTIAHELAHMFLGHLGEDPGRNVPDRSNRDYALREVEAETTAYLVAKRNGLTPKSESYLSSFQGSFEMLDIHAVMRAANAIEKSLGISAQRYWKEAKST